jgi:phospholipase/lecithinase/hemolysin
MGLSLRAYSRHRHVTLAAVQKALASGRITALPDGTIDPEVADHAWNAAAEARGATERIPADPARVVLAAGSLATAETTVRAVLTENGAPVSTVVTLADARLANELLRAKQRADAIAFQERARFLRQRTEATNMIDKRLVDALIVNIVAVITEFVDPRDLSAALDKMRALQARCVPGSETEE